MSLAKKLLLTVLWTLAVVICAGLLLWHVSSVFVRYYKCEIVTITEAGY